MTTFGIWAAVPVKSLEVAKQRLAPRLSAYQRRLLVLAMLNDVLEALADTPRLRGVMVISPDDSVLRAAAQAGASCIRQAADTGFAASADEAARLASRLYGADGIMVVPGDVPAATPADFIAVLAAHTGPGCTIVPSWDGEGSNCVLLSPPAAMRFRFGVDSFRRHVDEASRAGLAVRVVERPRLSRDVDHWADLVRLVGEPCGTHLRHLLPTLVAVPPPPSVPRPQARP